MRILVLLATHAVVLAIGFAAGIFALPLLTEPPAPPVERIMDGAQQARFTGRFQRDLADSDFLHWGEGEVFVHDDRVAFRGRLAPGPDYRLYFSPEFVETEADFLRLKSEMVEAGPVRTFENFLVSLPAGLDPGAFDTVIVWCESFEQFITAAQYR